MSDASGDADELARLRRRAYGPDADITADPAAQARLAELEAAHAGRPVAVGADASVPPVAATSGPLAGAREDARTEPVDPFATPALVRAQERPARRRRTWILMAGVAITALALVAAIDIASMGTPEPEALTSDDDAGEADAVLAPVTGRAGPFDPHDALDRLGLRADELQRYESFTGLAVWSGASRFGTMCLLVAQPLQGVGEGLGAEGCAPYGADTLAELLVADSSAQRLLRFVLEDDHVDVWVYETPADPGAGER